MADELRPRQVKFAGALLVARSVAEASQLAGVSERTGRRWAQLAQVRERLQEAESDAMSAAVRRAVAGMVEAVDVLSEIARDAKSPVGARVSAARALLEAAPRLWEARSLDERVAVLELRAEVRKR